jgi:hypothetical protein
MNPTIFQIHDKVQIISCQPGLGDLDGREVFISQIHPTRPNENFPRATVLLGQGETVEISTVFLQLAKPFYTRAAIVSEPVERGFNNVVAVGSSVLESNEPKPPEPVLSRGEKIRRGQQRRADELGISIEEYHRDIVAKRKKGGETSCEGQPNIIRIYEGASSLETAWRDNSARVAEVAESHATIASMLQNLQNGESEPVEAIEVETAPPKVAPDVRQKLDSMLETNARIQGVSVGELKGELVSVPKVEKKAIGGTYAQRIRSTPF